MHSCMHMLCAVVLAPVTGGSIHEGRGRLDFDLPEPIDKAEVTTKLQRTDRGGSSHASQLDHG